MNRRICKMLPHLSIIMALFLGTLWVLDQLNPLMGFTNNSISDVIQLVFCIIVLINGGKQIWEYSGEKE